MNPKANNERSLTLLDIQQYYNTPVHTNTQCIHCIIAMHVYRLQNMPRPQCNPGTMCPSRLPW